MFCPGLFVIPLVGVDESSATRLFVCFDTMISTCPFPSKHALKPGGGIWIECFHFVLEVLWPVNRDNAPVLIEQVFDVFGG